MSINYRYIGKETPRKDARNIVTGKARFFDDIKVPGMLYGKVKRSPHAHANIARIDVSRARELTGVRAVLIHEDVPPWQWGMPKHMPILAGKVRFVGDAVALVAADTPAIAEAALELIDVEYEPLPAVFDVEAAMQIDAPPIYAQFAKNTYPEEPPAFEPEMLGHILIGDTQKGFAEADFTIEDTCGYEIFPNPLPPEPPGFIATWETPDCLTVYTPSQSIAQVRLVGMPFIGMADIRAISTQCGGSYGTKNANLTPMGYAAVLAKATGKPVKVYFTKEEHFHSYSMRLGSRVRVKVGIKKDDTLSAIRGVWMVNTGSGSESGPLQIAVGLGEVQLVLRCANWDLKGKLICTNRSPSGIVRGYGGQELESSILPIIGRAMEKADIDPVEFFKKNTDCGRIIAPKVLGGQLHGAFGSAGLDTALFEETIIDETSGRMLNGNMVDYKWRTFTNLPDVKNVILETPIPSHRFKAVGVGEIATSPGPSAVLMAVYNAIGTRITSYPVTADKILSTCSKTPPKGAIKK